MPEKQADWPARRLTDATRRRRRRRPWHDDRGLRQHSPAREAGSPVITNSLPVAEAFVSSPQNEVIMTGGSLRAPIRALVGETTNRTLCAACMRTRPSYPATASSPISACRRRTSRLQTPIAPWPRPVGRSSCSPTTPRSASERLFRPLRQRRSATWSQTPSLLAKRDRSPHGTRRQRPHREPLSPSPQHPLGAAALSSLSDTFAIIVSVLLDFVRIAAPKPYSVLKEST